MILNLWRWYNVFNMCAASELFEYMVIESQEDTWETQSSDNHDVEKNAVGFNQRMSQLATLWEPEKKPENLSMKLS